MSRIQVCYAGYGNGSSDISSDRPIMRGIASQCKASLHSEMKPTTPNRLYAVVHTLDFSICQLRWGNLREVVGTLYRKELSISEDVTVKQNVTKPLSPLVTKWEKSPAMDHIRADLTILEAQTKKSHQKVIYFFAKYPMATSKWPFGKILGQVYLSGPTHTSEWLNRKIR